jgi:hypothetical protein
LAAFIVTTQVLTVPLQAPLHPVNVLPALGVAVRVTAVFATNVALHRVPQLIPLGLLDTLPRLVVLVTVSVYLGWIVKASAAVPVPTALVALRLTTKFPLTVGVPDILPVDVLTVRPDGSGDAPYLVGLSDAVI